MREHGRNAGFTALAKEARDIWNNIAEWWDERYGPEGNDFHRLLVSPATERLLNLKEDESLLDIACGNGVFSRRAAALGARVTAFDFSEKFIERARMHSKQYADRIHYTVLDATDQAQLMTLGQRAFDAAVCTMALMDMASIEPLAAALTQLLKPGGRFVFSVTHPCFHSPGTRMTMEEAYRGSDPAPVFAVKVTEYLTPIARKGVGIVGQPETQYYFHRPLYMLFSTFFAVGFVLDGLEEPKYPEAAESGSARPRGAFSWRNYSQIPPALVARLRLL